jgi:hypothetical protein
MEYGIYGRHGVYAIDRRYWKELSKSLNTGYPSVLFLVSVFLSLEEGSRDSSSG